VPKVHTVGPTEAKDGVAEEPIVEKVLKLPEILRPSAAAELPKVHKTAAATPKRWRMASVLDAVIETTKALTPAPTKKAAEAAKNQVEAKAGPSAPTETKASVPKDKVGQQISDTGKMTEQDMEEKANSHVPEALVEDIDYIVRHASGKNYLKKKSWRPNTMPKD
jgi:hypothetical protein